MRRSTDSRLFAAAALFAVGVLVFGASLARALSAPGVAQPTREAETDAAQGTDASPPWAEPGARDDDGDALPVSALLLAVDHDPFRPDRQRAPNRYLLPGETLPEPPPPAPGPPPPPAFRLVGTAVTPDGGLAMLQLENTAPRLVALGESLLGYTVTRVTTEGAVLEGQQGQVVSLLLSRAVAFAGPPAGARQQQGRGPGGAPAAAMTQFDRAAAIAQERALMVERMIEQSGATPQQIEAMRRLLESTAGRAVQNDQVGGNAIILRRTLPDSIRPPNLYR